MPSSRRTDASIAFSVTDNLSQSIVAMKNSLSEFRNDAAGLQKQLDMLDKTKIQLKNVDLKQAKQELQQAEKAIRELGDAATEADRAAANANFERASQNYENIRAQLDLTSRQARQTQKDLLDATGAISKVENRAGSSVDSVLSALGKAGLFSMAGDAAGQWGNLLVGSAFGSDAGGLFGSALSGAASGAAIGSVIPGIGTAVGTAIGGVIGLASGGAQAAESRDQAFAGYYSGLYDQQQSAQTESQASGSATAAQRELDAIAFNRLLGAGVGDQYLADLRGLAADTPMEYENLTGMSRALATGFGDSPERMLELMTAIGDAGSAVGVTAADMTVMAQTMSRMNSSGKATLEYLNIFQDRGVDVIGMLGEAMGKTQGQIYGMISKGEINGQRAADIIQAGMESRYSGSMEEMARTFEGLTSTLSDTMTELNAAYGDGYNDTRKGGLQAEIDAYGGALGEAIQSLNGISGQNAAYLENLGEQYKREALGSVLLGEDTTLFSEEDQTQLAELRQQFAEASAQYAETGDRNAAITMESTRSSAEMIAQAAYENSEQYRMLQDAQEDSLDAIRSNTSALEAATAAYELAQERTKGAGGGVLDAIASLFGDPEADSADPAMGDWSYNADLDGGSAGAGHAYGLRRVPYDNYAALLHEGERVLTAREAREQDRGGGAPSITVQVSGNTFGAGLDEEAVAQHIAEAVWIKAQAGFTA
ncbi:MAG: hypothetical protein EGR72_11540 [Clostridiales bacterium]|nr:hypothetical protein [Clostridiales bacterium]